MSWMRPDLGVVTSVGMKVGEHEQIVLRVDRDGGPFLTIGEVEMVLSAAHIVSLVEQARPVLAELGRLDVMDAWLDEAEAMGDQTASVAEYAAVQAAAALRAGAEREAMTARMASAFATDAAAVLASAVRTAHEAMEAAKAVLEQAGEAAAAARAAAEVSASA